MVYLKTTNGGVNWGTLGTVNSAITGWTSVSVWYDQWTPGDTSGTRIHIAASDDVADDIFYAYLDTNGDTLKESMVTAVSGTTTLTEAVDGPPSITKGGGGALFISGNFTSAAGGKIAKSTDGAGDAWSDVTSGSWSSVAIDQIQLLQLFTGNDIIAIKAQTADNTIRYQICNETDDVWPVSWNNIATLTENTTYDQWFSASLKKSTGDIYLAFANQTNNAANDIEFWSFDDSSRGDGFAQKTSLFTNDATVMMPTPLIDENTGDIYVAYLRGTLATAVQVYYKKSTDGGTSWGGESASLSPGLPDDHKSLRGNILSTERLYVVWHNDDLNDIMGNTVADIVPSTYIDQSAYLFYANTDSTDVGSALQDQNTAANVLAQGTPFRLRLLLHISGLQLGQSGQDFKLQVAQRGVDNVCDSSFSGETYTDLSFSSCNIRFYNNTTPGIILL